MANTKIPSELSSTPSISDSGNATAISIDSSEIVSITQSHTASVTDATTMVAGTSLKINGNTSEGSDNLRVFAMADGTGNYGMEVSNSGGTAAYQLCLNPINRGRVTIGHTSGASGDFVISKAGAEGMEFFAGNSSDVNVIQHYNRTNSNYVDNKIIANSHIFTSGGTELVKFASGTNGADCAKVQGQLRLNGGSLTRLTIASNANASSNKMWNFDNDAGTLRIFDEDWSATGSGANGVVRLRLSTSYLFSGDVGVAGNPIAVGCNIGSSNWLGLTADLPGYSNGIYPTLKGTYGNLYISTGGGYTAYINSSGTYNVASDQRLKENVVTLEDSLDKVNQLRGVTFNWIDDSRGTDTQVGFIAQEVEAVIPELVSTGDLEDDENGEAPLKTVNYANMTALLVEAVKELKAENDALKTRIEALEG
jgi:hypothetical protein